MTPETALSDDRNTEDVLLNTPGAHSDSNSDIATTNSDLYPKITSSHQYSVCSSRGICDSSTGQCKCFDGFEGKGCRRTSCPNDCSGHGRCLTNWAVSGSSSFVSNNDQFWDQSKSQQCSCDRGFSGYDCSYRICPFGDDPTTECGENSASDFQLVSVSAAADTFFTLRFTDMFGGDFETRPIDPSKCNAGEPCREVQFALMELPNFAIPNVEVDQLSLSSSSSDEHNYRISFVDSANVGKQNTLACNVVSDPSGDGSSPKYSQAADCSVLDVGLPEWFDAAGGDLTSTTVGSGQTIDSSEILSDAVDSVSDGLEYDSFVPCANKGLCDSATGTCSCFDGHYGEACESQSTYY